jgi:Protein of unknown function (DUF4012)
MTPSNKNAESQTERSGPRHGSARRGGSGRSRTQHWIWWTVGGLAVVVIGGVVWIGARGMLAKQELEAAVPLARTAQEQVISGDADAARAIATQLSKHAAAAASLTSDPVWRAAEFVPWVGPNLEGMRAIAASVDRVADGAVTPLADAAAQIDLSAFAPSGGRVDLAAVLALQAPVREAAAAVDEARSMMLDQRVASAELIAPLADARAELTALLVKSGETVDGLDRAVQLAPVMLGSEGPRNTLLLFQNNAELRSTGGIAGALGLVHTDNGGFTLTKQADSGDFPKFEPPVVDLPVETRALYGDNTASYIQDVNFTPQFPLAASIAREMWQRRFGDEVDSVIALDPVVLSRLLVATGPVALPSGDTLTSENAVQLLLRDVYARYSQPQAQDAFFASAAAAVLDALSGDNVDPRALIEAFIDSGYTHRILIWNADAAEQAMLQGTSLAGGLPESTAHVEAFGVYFNDTTGSKMDPYLDVKVAAGAIGCRADGRQNYVVDVSLTNTAPADAAASLPPYVTGDGDFGTPPGMISTSVQVYAAPGNFNLGVLRDGTPAPYHPTSDAGYTLSKIETRLGPGESATYRFGFLAGEPGERSVEIVSTPLVYELETSGLAISCESVVR